MEETLELSKITYRLFDEKDKKGVLRLWDESHWGAITVEQFNKWFLNTPYGNCIIVIATDEKDEVIGQLIFTPSRMHVRGKEIKTLRIAASVMRKDFHFLGSDFQDFPINKMFNLGISVAAERNFVLAYIFPAKGWLRAVEAAANSSTHWETATFDGFTIPLDSPFSGNLIKDENIDFSIASEFTNEYNDLWSDAVKLLPINCGIVRKKEWLKYRLGAHLTIEARNKNNKELLGYCTIKRNSGLLVDLLARTENELEKMLTGAISTLHFSNPFKIPVGFKNVTGMYTPLIKNMATSLCILPLDYKFNFGCYVLNQAVNLEFIKPTEWYMMPDV